MEYGVILTRAQPFHRGHADVIKQALSENDRVLLVVGSANKAHTGRNPFDIDKRMEIIEGTEQELIDVGIDTRKVMIMRLPDWAMEDAKEYAGEWGNFFYYNVVAAIQKKTFAFYYNDDPETVKKWFGDKIAERIAVKNAKRERDASGTKIRKAIMDGDEVYLKKMLFESTYKIRHTLRDMLGDATKKDFMMD